MANCARPEKALLKFADDGETDLKAGDTVKAKHVGGSIIAAVGEGDAKEFWHSHGAYGRFVDGKRQEIPTEELWAPRKPGEVPSRA